MTVPQTQTRVVYFLLILTNSLLNQVRNATDLNFKRTLNKIKELRSFGYTGQPDTGRGSINS